MVCHPVTAERSVDTNEVTQRNKEAEGLLIRWSTRTSTQEQKMTTSPEVIQSGGQSTKRSETYLHQLVSEIGSLA